MKGYQLVWVVGFCLMLAPPSWQASEQAIDRFARRSEINVLEDRVPEYTLPDALQFQDGRRVEDGEDWKRRREELKELFQDHVYGRRPEEPSQVTSEVIEEDRNALDGSAVVKKYQVSATLSEDGEPFTFQFTLVAPKGKPRPVFILISHRNPENMAPADGPIMEFWPIDLISERGYATAIFEVDFLAPDDNETYRDGLLARILPEGARSPTATGGLMAWSWGASRVLDVLEDQPSVDAERAAVIGHSRGGKAALVTGAMDERFALTISNESGCSGAALSRRQFGEKVKQISTRFLYWFCPRYADYNDRESELPIDQHQLISLAAPRAVAIGSADLDLWADPRGEWLALTEAGPVYRLLGVESVEPGDPMPSLGQPIDQGQTHYHVRPDAHNLTVVDWKAYLDFADQLWN